MEMPTLVKEFGDHGPRPGFEVVALVTSAGGLKALTQILRELPADFPAAVLVAQHRSAGYPDHLPELLGAAATLRVKRAEEGEVPLAGVVYTAPTGRHLLVGPVGDLSVRRTERVRFVRPSADLLLESVAAR